MSQPSHGSPPPPVQMLQIMMGYWVAQTAAAIARFDIPDHLSSGPRSADDLARAVDANPSTLRRLLRAAASVGMLREVTPGTFASTPLGDTLRREAPGSLRDLVVAELATGHWLPWGKLYEAVKSGKSRAREALGMNAWEYYAKNSDEGGTFARGMSNLSAIVAAETLPAFDFRP
jgi:Dimerisation domain